MDKLKYIKLENEDGSYSNSIPLAVDSDYVDINGENLTEIIGEINLEDDGNVGEQLLELKNNKTNSVDFENSLKDNYYDEISYTKENFYDTDCYITSIPKYDKNGDQIKLYVAYCGGDSPTEYARNNFTTLTINASSYITDIVDSSLSGVPIMIGNGQILRNHPMISSGVADNILYIGITGDRQLREYQVNTTTAQQMLNDGCEQVFDVYYKLIENGQALDLSEVRVKGSNDIVTEKHPRQCLGEKQDGTIIILSCDGRSSSIGLTSAQTQEILLNKGCINAWNIDGGGSTSTSINGIKINKNIDNGGTVDRKIPYVLNVKKSINNKEIAKAFSKIGEVKEELFGQILPDVWKSFGEDLSSKDANNLIGKLYMGYGNSLSSLPTTTSGYLINIPHSGVLNEDFKEMYNLQLYFTRDTNNSYVRRQVNGIFSPWTKINGENLTMYNSGGNIVISSSDREKLPFKFSDSNNLIIQGVEGTKDGNGRYTEFKMNITGLFLIEGYINLVPKTADGDRYISLLKNNEQIDNLRVYEKVDNADIVYFETLINNDSINNIYSINFTGQNNDSIVRMRINIGNK